MVGVPPGLLPPGMSLRCATASWTPLFASFAFPSSTRPSFSCTSSLRAWPAPVPGDPTGYAVHTGEMVATPCGPPCSLRSKSWSSHSYHGQNGSTSPTGHSAHSAPTQLQWEKKMGVPERACVQLARLKLTPLNRSHVPSRGAWVQEVAMAMNLTPGGVLGLELT